MAHEFFSGGLFKKVLAKLPMSYAPFTPKLACVAGVQTGGREEVKFQREESAKSDRWDLGGNNSLLAGVPSQIPTIALRARM